MTSTVRVQDSDEKIRAGRRCVLLLGLLLPALLAIAACSENERGEERAELTLTGVDTVLSELGGPLTDSLSRQQRWRMISSIGTGLPPQDFQTSDLPEAQSYGAAMLQVYCEQCHWLPSPQMHSATEWPLLVRRMLLRSRTVQDRLGGPATRSLVGSWMIDIIKKVGVPAPAQQDSLVAYLQRNALPVAGAGEIGRSAEALLFAQLCSVCHETPSPRAHDATEWPEVVQRMQSNMAKMDVRPLTAAEADSITAFLVANSGNRGGS